MLVIVCVLQLNLYFENISKANLGLPLHPIKSARMISFYRPTSDRLFIINKCHSSIPNSLGDSIKAENVGNVNQFTTA